MKPITLPPEFIQTLRGDLMAELTKTFGLEDLLKSADASVNNFKMTDGLFSFEKSFKFSRKFELPGEKRRVRLMIDPIAFTKISYILATNSKEIGWHGVSERVSDTEFVVKDVMVYPQEVTACNIDTDKEEYDRWMNSIPAATFNNMHVHMHSHVNMSVFPSSTDMGHRKEIVSQLRDHDYYIFMIWNKSMAWSAAIYDMPTNTLFETSDIDLGFYLGDGKTSFDLGNEIKSKVRDYAPLTTKTTAADSKKTQPALGSGTPVVTAREITKEDIEAGNGLDRFRREGYLPGRDEWVKGCNIADEQDEGTKGGCIYPGYNHPYYDPSRDW